MKKISVCLIISLFIVPLACGQVPELIRKPAFRKDAQAAVDSIYNFNNKAAEKRLQKWSSKYPKDPLWQLMQGVEDWWVILSDLNDTSQDKKLHKVMKKAGYEASKLLYKHPDHADALIVRMVANGYIARQYSDRDEWVKSLSAARKAYSAYKHLKKVLPDLPDLKLAEGLKLYYAKYLPEAYPVVKTFAWFLPEGNKKKGLKEMHQAAEQAIFARGEALYFLGNININYEHHYKKAAHYFTLLYQRYPHNNYYTRLLVKSLYKMDRHQKALTVINTSLQRWQKNDLAFAKVLEEELYYWKGRIMLNRGETQKAEQLFRKSFSRSKALPRPRHRSFYSSSAYYLGDSLMKDGRRNEAATYFKKVLKAKTNDSLIHAAQKHLREINGES